MTRISTGTVSIGNGETIFTLWDGDDDVVLSEITAPAQSSIVIEGVANFIKTRLSTTSAELVLPHSGAGGAGLACAISALTPAETQIGTLNARTARVIQELETVEANGRGLFYRFSDTTTDADPGAGYLRFNQLDLTTATAAYIDVLDANGGTVSGEIDTWDDSTSLGKGNLWVRSIAAPSAFRTYAVTGSVVEAAGYRKLTLTHIGGSGSFAAGDELMVAYARTGDRGDGYITDATVADPSELTALEAEDAGHLVFVTDLQTDFGAYSGRSGVVELISGPDWELVAIYTGPPGVQGPIGDTGPTGPKGINWQGEYSGATFYVEDDGVLHNGSSWRALVPTTGNAPPNLPTASNTWWRLVARAGTDGAGTVASIAAGTGIRVDATDPSAPEVSIPLGINVLDYAAADDATDDGAAFESAQTAAIAAGSKLVVVPAGDYLINTQVDLAAEVTWMFLGARLRTSLDAMTILSADTISDWALIGSVHLMGSKVGPGGETAQKGLYIKDCERYRVEGVLGRALKGMGFHLTGTLSPSERARGRFSNCAAHGCAVGRQLDAGNGAEYTTWTNWNASGNDVGETVGAGNTVTNGGSIVDNTVGVKLIGGTNHGHGIHSGVQINHNGKNLVATDVALGHTFADCHWYDGDIELTNCAGIVLDGGDMDEPVLVVTSGAGSSYNYVRNIRCVGTLGQVVPSGTGVAQLVVQNCFGPGAPSRSSTFQADSYVYRNKGSTQALTSGVQATLVLPGEVSDPLGAYNAATGVFTVPPGMGGMYEISWSLVFDGTGLDETASYVDFVSDLAGDNNFTSNVLSLPTKFGSSKLVFNGLATLRYPAATQMKLLGSITGTSPVMGSSDWFCLASFKRIGN